MSLLDDVSIVVTPNGYKAGVLYSAIPSSGAADLEVVRASAATRVDENGLVNYAEIVGDEEVTNGDFATDLSGWNITSGGWVWSSGRAYWELSDVFSRLEQTISIDKTVKVSFDIEIISGRIIVVADTYSGNYRELGRFDNSDNGTLSFILDDISTFETFRDIECEYYIDNISIKEVTRDNVPRIDYSGGGCPHILAEPERTNLVTYSEDFSQWTANGVSLDYNQGTSPDGLSNATRLHTSTDGNLYLSLANTSFENTISFYVKSNNQSKDNFQLRLGGTTIDYTATSDWVRYTYATTPNSTVAAIRNVASEDLDVLIWGAQLEEGSYATSYIPTDGSTVTRVQDTFSRDGIASLINSEEGCIFGEGSFLESTAVGYDYFISISDGSLANRLEIRRQDSELRFLWRVGGSYVGNIITSGLDVGSNFKFAVNYSSTNIKFYVNGNLIATISSPTLYSSGTLNRLGLDEGDGSVGHNFFGKVKQLQVFKKALTDSELIALTT